MSTLTPAQALIVKWSKQPMPITTLPLAMKDDLHALIGMGLVKIETRPGKTRPDRTYSYIVKA